MQLRWQHPAAHRVGHTRRQRDEGLPAAQRCQQSEPEAAAAVRWPGHRAGVRADALISHRGSRLGGHTATGWAGRRPSAGPGRRPGGQEKPEGQRAASLPGAHWHHWLRHAQLPRWRRRLPGQAAAHGAARPSAAAPAPSLHASVCSLQRCTAWTCKQGRTRPPRRMRHLRSQHPVCWRPTCKPPERTVRECRRGPRPPLPGSPPPLPPPTARPRRQATTRQAARRPCCSRALRCRRSASPPGRPSPQSRTRRRGAPSPRGAPRWLRRRARLRLQARAPLL